MSILQSFILKLSPEIAHKLAIFALKNFSFCFPRVIIPSCPVTVWGRKFSNPLGLAAGFDKDAEALVGLERLGFGFIELGTVTPKPQHGNNKPRIFRDINTKSVINRMGFPSYGVKNFKVNLQRDKTISLPVGLNIGKNKETEGIENILADYKLCIRELKDYADYFVVNVSSPNTAGLRDLQTKEALAYLLSGLIKEKQGDAPLLVKIAPDLDDKQLQDIAGVIIDTGCDGVIISNTTIIRPKILPQAFAVEQGGLSGDLLKQASVDMIRNFYQITDGNIPIIGVGGVSSGQDIYNKICAGASLVQLYTAFIFEGSPIITRVMNEFCDILQKNGIKDCSEIIGIDTRTGLR